MFKEFGMKKLFAFMLFYLSVVGCAASEIYKVYVTQPAGSASDLITRRLFSDIAMETGNTYVVINRTGANHMIGYREFLTEAKTNPNTILFLAGGLFTGAYYYSSDQGFDPVTQLKGVSTVLRFDLLMVARSDSNIKNVSQMNNKKLNIAYASPQAEHIFRSLNLVGDINLVPYKAETDLILALLRGEVDAAITIEVNPALRTHSDKLQVVQGTPSNKNEFLSIAVPANVTEAARSALNRNIVNVVNNVEFREWIKNTVNVYPESSTPDQLDRIMYRTRENVRKQYGK